MPTSRSVVFRDEPMTTPMIVPREEVARNLSVSVTMLTRYESRGLVRPIVEGGVVGYGPAEIRRLWTIVSCQRDLGINLAGVEAVLKLRDHLASVHDRLEGMASRLRDAIEDVK